MTSFNEVFGGLLMPTEAKYCEGVGWRWDGDETSMSLLLRLFSHCDSTLIEWP